MSKPLNIPLYNAMVKAFGDVSISRPGEPVVLKAAEPTPVTKQLSYGRKRKKLPSRIVDDGECYTVNCPFCGDKRKRLWLCHAWDSHTTDEDGKIIYVGKEPIICYNEQCLQDPGNFRKLESMIHIDKDAVTPIACSTNEEAVTNRIIRLPFGIPLKDVKARYVKDYVEQERGFSTGELSDDWGVQVSKIWFYPEPCLVFPVVQNDICKGWQARYIGEGSREKLDKPKYYIPRGFKKSWALYNMDRARLFPVVVLTEGVLDAIKVGKAAVAMFGKKPSLFQFKLLANFWRNSTLVWIPDEDDVQSWKIANTYTEEWNVRKAFAGGAHVVRLPHGDPALFKKEEIWDLILKTVPQLSKYAESVTQ